MPISPIAGAHTAMVYGQAALGRDLSPQAAGLVAATHANAVGLRKLVEKADDQANFGIRDVGETSTHTVQARVEPRNRREGEAGTPRRRIDVLA